MSDPGGAEHRPLVTLIVGTRPEAIKMRPVARALSLERSLELQIVLTGQHRGLATTFDGMAIEDLALDMREQTAGEIAERVHHALCQAFLRRRPALVLVQGDTSSALGGALAAADMLIPLGHVEAGLRSFDFHEPWPEEGYRVAIDHLSDLLFAPTEAAFRNLEAEGLHGSVHVTGNTGIDALYHVLGHKHEAEAQQARRLILVTCHRRENRDERLRRIAEALRRLPRELPVEIVLPLHTNPRRSRVLQRLLADAPGIELLPPLDHAAMVRLMARCWLLLTDSGGLQEEGPALGKPVFVIRETTERIESPDNCRLVGTDPDHIVRSVAALLDDERTYRSMTVPTRAYGDGKAAERIAKIVERFLNEETAREAQLSRTASTLRLSGDDAERPGSGWL